MGWIVDQKFVDFIREVQKQWPVIMDVVNRVLRLRGDGVTNNHQGIVIQQTPQSRSPQPAGASGGSAGATRMKTIGASDANQVVTCGTWNGITLGGDVILVRVTVPIQAGAELYAIKVTPNTGATYNGLPVTWAELLRGDYSTSPTVIGSASEAGDTADTLSADLGAATVPFNVYGVSRVEYNDAGDKVLYMFLRLVKHNNRGMPYFWGPETRITVDTPTSCATSLADASDDNSELPYLMA